MSACRFFSDHQLPRGCLRCAPSGLRSYDPRTERAPSARPKSRTNRWLSTRTGRPTDIWILIVGAIPKWAIFAPIFVPLFIKLRIAPEAVLAAYRVGDSPPTGMSPLMPYFALIVVFAQRYQKFCEELIDAEEGQLEARRQEFGIRAALGASRASIMHLVLFGGARTLLTGILGGGALCLVTDRTLQRWIKSSLYDPVLLVVVCCGLGFVVVAASCPPAWRGANADPIRTLRENSR